MTAKKMYKKRGCTCKVVRNINHIIRFWWSRNRRRRRILNGLQYYSKTGKCVEAPWPLSGGLLWGNSAINSIDRKQKKKRKRKLHIRLENSIDSTSDMHRWGGGGEGVFQPWHLIQVFKLSEWLNIRASCQWRFLFLSFFPFFFTFVFLSRAC